MAAAKRILLFKIITITVFAAVIIVLITKIVDFISPANSNAAYMLNKSINDRNTAYAKGNRFGFTDKERTEKKVPGVYRIAVIGDSFIWGDGIPYEKIWSHKLEEKLLSEYDSVEIISWGKNGWSTLDEFKFLKQHGKAFNIDLFIIGWVDNDPDVGLIPQLNASDAAIKYPNAYKVWPGLARFLLNNTNSDAYSEWLDKIYSEQNLIAYQKVLSQFHEYLIQNNIKSFIVMTPASLHGSDKKHFNIIKPIINQAGFQYLDVYDSVESKFKNYSIEELQANPANGHPGNLMTSEFADETEIYLQQNNYLSKLHKKRL